MVTCNNWYPQLTSPGIDYFRVDTIWQIISSKMFLFETIREGRSNVCSGTTCWSMPRCAFWGLNIWTEVMSREFPARNEGQLFFWTWLVVENGLKGHPFIHVVLIHVSCHYRVSFHFGFHPTFGSSADHKRRLAAHGRFISLLGSGCAPWDLLVNSLTTWLSTGPYPRLA